MASSILIGTTKAAMKIVKSAAETEHGHYFEAPVAELWPDVVDSYRYHILNPIDLRTIHTKLKESTYPNIEALKKDIRLIADNAAEFNGPLHEITQAAYFLCDNILDELDDVIPITGTRVQNQCAEQAKAGIEAANTEPAGFQLPDVELEVKRVVFELDPPDNGLPTSTPQQILPRKIEQIVDVIVQAETHLSTAQSVDQAQIWLNAANTGIDGLQKAGYNTTACSVKLASFLPPEFELAPHDPTLVQRRREYVMRDVMVLKDERSAVKAQVNALKVEELKLLAEQKRLKTSIEEVEYLLEQHTEQQREGDRVVTTLSNQIHELLNSFCDDQYPPQSNKRQYPEGDDEEPVMTRSRRGGRHV